MTESNQTTEKSISSADFAGLWGKLTHNQQRFAVAMLESPTKKEAALAVGLEPDTVYRWNGDVDAVVGFMRSQVRDSVLGIIEANAVKAAMVKAGGLDSADELRRQDASTEMLNRYLGRPSQRTEISGPEGGDIGVQFSRTFDQALDRIFGDDEDGE